VRCGPNIAFEYLISQVQNTICVDTWATITARALILHFPSVPFESVSTAFGRPDGKTFWTSPDQHQFPEIDAFIASELGLREDFLNVPESSENKRSCHFAWAGNKFLHRSLLLCYDPFHSSLGTFLRQSAKVHRCVISAPRTTETNFPKFRKKSIVQFSVRDLLPEILFYSDSYVL
jgi:hypothetical protein